MKRFIYILIAFSAMIFFAAEANAQMGKRMYVNAGWQFNGTIANDYVENAQGYGAYLEGGYYITPMIAVGGFASFGTNNEYIHKKTYSLEDNAAITTDLDHSLYQVPFGSTIRVRFMRSEFQPYVEAKIGSEYSTQSTYMSTFVNRQDNWGFYISPEIGITFFPFHKDDVGFQFAAYYSYATNRNDSFDIKGLNNLGLKLGMAF